MVGIQYKENGGLREHMAMISKLKIWPSGKYKIWYAETSPIRQFPYTATKFEFGSRLFTFFPR